jgi:polyisoprenoid-binding protein YceI
VDVVIDARGIWTGEPDRDAHLRSADFLDVERHPEIRFRGRVPRATGALDWQVEGELTIRGVTRPATLDVHYQGRWTTPWWEGGVDKGPKIRAGFVATTKINRHDFGVSWNATLDRGGLVVGDEVEITIDAEAILEDDPDRDVRRGR